MASRPLSAVQLVQNPAFGAAVLWRFARGFQDEAISTLPNFELLFLVFPIVMHTKTLQMVSSTLQGSGLGKFASKLAEDREELLAVHDRALAMRLFTLQSIATAVSTKLLSIDHATAIVRANEAKFPKPPERIKAYFPASEKFGRWAGRLPPNQPFSLLQVYP